ncbi:hypothetical protein [Polyangium sp. 15x6]|uniref:hypothetical protein n=1 Tax=Polyangium sp. 15x6 TaxID=3042687 RepID=UPI00249B6626|nr:hypothetical protein [Polyangium sp. 15x6]MDI3283723.1 hypothetical protein [Polyangium sp. 15x6]
MRKLQGLILSLASIVILTACGAIAEGEQAPAEQDEGAVLEAEQALCGLPSTAGCDEPAVPVPEGTLCELPNGFDFKYHCGNKGTAGCRVFDCTAGGTWYTATAGPACEDLVALYCH